MKKTTKKTKKPSYIVNMDHIQTLEDIDVEFGLAKQEAGLPISDDELVAICKKVCDETVPRLTVVSFANCTCEKKKPWYKRFWNWLTGKK